MLKNKLPLNVYFILTIVHQCAMFNLVEQGVKVNNKTEFRVMKEIKRLFVENRWGILVFAETNKKHKDFENDVKIGDDIYQLKYITNTDLNYIRHQKARHTKEKVIFVKDYLNRKDADEMIKENINFIDTAGNAFIKNNRIHIEITGKRKELFETIMIVREKMTPAAVKLNFLLLRDPNAINKPYRQLAKDAGIGFGGVTKIFEDLKRNNYIVVMNGKKILTNTRKLFDKWVEGYLQNLNHKIILGNYKFGKAWTEFKGVNKTEAKWGGEVAAYKLGGNIKPAELTLYIDQNYYDELIKTNMLLKEANGNVLLKNKFWNFEDKGDMVDAMIVYVDLIGNGNQRDEEAAKLIYETHIAKHLR